MTPLIIDGAGSVVQPHGECTIPGACIACARDNLRDPALIAKIAANAMPECFVPTRASFVALAQIAWENIRKAGN